MENLGLVRLYTIISEGEAIVKTFAMLCLVGFSFLTQSALVFAADCPETLNFMFRPLAGEEKVNLCKQYLGKVVLVVNTASKCGNTPQYEGLEALYKKYREKGLVVLGFPSNDFGAQEPGTEKDIEKFCRNTYSVQFPMFEKTSVARGVAHPMFVKLATDAGGDYPAWNFHKYLLNKDGKLVKSFSNRMNPQSQEIVQEIERLL